MPATKDIAPETDTETLEADMKKLREDLKMLRDDMAAIGANALKEAKGGARNRAGEIERSARELADDAASEIEEIQRNAEQAVRKKPLTAVAAALAIGYFLGGLATRR